MPEPDRTRRPVISVIVPAYNSAGTLVQALDSIDAQTFTDYEVLIVDDASTDATVEVAEGWLREHGCPALAEGGEGWRRGACGARAVALAARAENAGPAAARNAGIRAAAGQWVAFLDADDQWLPGKLARQWRVAEAHPDAALICGPVLPLGGAEARGTPDGGRPGNVVPADAGTSRSECRVIPRDVFAERNPVATSTVLVKRDALATVAGFDEQFRGPEDYDLWIRVAAQWPVLATEAPLSLYRHVPGSLSMDDRTFLPQVVRVLEKGFGPGGGMRDLRHLRRTAMSTQFWNASWMAYHRGARGTAVRYWLKAYVQHVFAARRVRRKWFPLLWRYVFRRPFVESAGRRGGSIGQD